MNVLQNLTELYNHLSLDSTYRNVCKGILEHLEEAADGTIYEIAELTNSSRTTIWRMVQKMGYHNFSEFHHELRRAVKQYTYYNRILPQQCTYSGEAVKTEMLRQITAAHQCAAAQIDPSAVEAAAEALKEADRIVFYTPYKGNAILSLQQNLAMDGKQTAYFSLFPDILQDSQELTGESVVFTNMIEHLETIDMKPVFENIKKSGARVFGVAGEKSRYRRYIDKELFRSGEGNIVEGILLFEAYFFMLSEIYRIKYIE